MWHVWLIFAGVFFILETVTTGFFIFWLGVGSLIALLVSFITDSIIIQTVVFIISSILLIVSTKPLVDKIIHNKKSVVTNAYTIIGKNAVVVEEINPLKATGQIKVNGEIWSAKSLDSDIISKDSNVEICAIEGVKACVKLIPLNRFSNIADI